MTSDEALQKFGLPASPEYRDEIRDLLTNEINLEKKRFVANEAELDVIGRGEIETLRTFCLQLFSLGFPDDSLLIWDAKESTWDNHCSIDVQLLCGAGISATKTFLATSKADTAQAALQYIIECEQSGDFTDWTPQTTIDYYRQYYGL
jgi:hypothetical protein